jgi:hypothetical protein
MYSKGRPYRQTYSVDGVNLGRRKNGSRCAFAKKAMRMNIPVKWASPPYRLSCCHPQEATAIAAWLRSRKKEKSEKTRK